MTPEAMARLHARAFAGQGRAWRREEFDALLRAPGVFTLPAADGFAMGRLLIDEAELLTIAVAPEQRRAGRGAALLAAFEAMAARRGAARAVLEVAADNTAARALYRRFGYDRIGCRRGYYPSAAGPAVDALLLAKSLDGPGRTA